MSILDGDDGKPFAFTRQILGAKFQRLVGDAFGQRILEERTKDEPVLQLMNNMFGGSVSDLPDNIQEVYEAIEILESQPVPKQPITDKEQQEQYE